MKWLHERESKIIDLITCLNYYDPFRNYTKSQYFLFTIYQIFRIYFYSHITSENVLPNTQLLHLTTESEVLPLTARLEVLPLT
ncbi:hypothetical protein PSY30_23300, partial [Shigella flexneri]|nr:hypothetical protein [Shigella flexneri]